MLRGVMRIIFLVISVIFSERLNKKHMKKLHEVVKERSDRELELSKLTSEFERNSKVIEKEIIELKKLENMAQGDINILNVQIAESVIYIKGNPYGKADSSFNAPTIAELAITDIANDCPHLKTKFFGNKSYGSFYQRTNCEYGYGPRHGCIVDEIGLINPDNPLSEEEKDACIYYIQNYQKISEAKTLKN
jgi:hypothetical protein